MSSPVVLSLSTVFALVGIVLVAIAFGTNSWQIYKVDRQRLFGAYESNGTVRQYFEKLMLKDFESVDLTVDRWFGLFRECFEQKLPKDLLRSQVALYIVGLAFLLMSLFTGIAGCWRRGSMLILITGVMLLFAALFLSGSMAIWHGIDFVTRDQIVAVPYPRTWPQQLRDATDIKYGWSYIIAWVGIGCILIASITMLVAYRSMKEEEMGDEQKNPAYLAASYYDKQALVPYGSTIGSPYGYAGAYPAYYGTYGNGYNPYGYVTYGR